MILVRMLKRKKSSRPSRADETDAGAEAAMSEWDKMKLKLKPFKSEDRWKLLDALKNYHQVAGLGSLL